VALTNLATFGVAVGATVLVVEVEVKVEIQYELPIFFY
jgi:hypothetical protein